MKRFTLCVICVKRYILLAPKLRGMGKGKLNAPGGKVEGAETDAKTCVRESLEELGIRPISLRKRGILKCAFVGNPKIFEICVFSASRYEGTPQATEEMGKPEFVSIRNIPYGKMWPADKYWLPLLLSGKSFEGEFQYQDENTLISHRIRVVN